MLDDLQRLPSQALTVIRYLAGRESAAADKITGATGLSERAFGKAIRALITRRFAEMSQPGVYRLSARGREALETIDGGGNGLDDPASVADAPAAAPAASHERQLSVLVAREWVRHLPARLMIGFDAAPAPGAASPTQTLVLRVQAAGCLIDPSEHALDVPARKPAGPVQFRLTPHEGRTIHVRVEVYRDGMLMGGLFFEVPVTDFPTPLSAQFHALGAVVPLESHA